MSWSLRSRCAVTGAVSALLLGSGASVANAENGARAGEVPVPELAWEDCATDVGGSEAGVQCAVAALPLDYDDPDGDQVHIAVARVPATDPAQRIGSLFFNFGGPGAATVDYLQAVGAGVFENLNQQFDIVGFDPRGVGQSTPAIDCQADEEKQGVYSVPVPTPLDIDVDAYVAKAQSYVDACLANNGAILEHVSTANVARDMDALRAALGEEQICYLGYSYGTFLGATYASLFPDRYRAMTLDGPRGGRRIRQRPAEQPGRPDRGLRGRARPLLRGVCGRPGRVLRLRRHRPVAGLRQAPRRCGDDAHPRDRIHAGPASRRR